MRQEKIHQAAQDIAEGLSRIFNSKGQEYIREGEEILSNGIEEMLELLVPGPPNLQRSPLENRQRMEALQRAGQADW